MPKMHKLLGPDHFERLGRDAEESIRKRIEWLAQGKGDRQSIHGSMCRDSIWLGCIALILGRGDDEASGHFRKAADYAVEWLRAPGSAGSPRVYDMNLEAAAQGARVTSLHERKPSREPAKHSLISYTEILFATLTFGEDVQMREVAEYPEEGYRNPNVLGRYEDLRVWKAWILGREDEARRAALRVLEGSPEPIVKASISALVAILDGQLEAFGAQLEEHVKAHKKHYQRHPNDPQGFVSMGGLALCRLALERGMRAQDQPYLPMRLLPNARRVAVE